MQFESVAVLRGLVDASCLADVVSRARSERSSPFELLVAEGHVDEGALALVLGEALGIPVIGGDELHVESTMALDLPRSFGVHHSMIPLRTNDGSVEVAAANPFDMAARENLKSLTGLNPVLRVATATQVRRAWASQFRIRDELAVTGGLSDDQSASRIITRGQLIVLLLIATAVGASAAVWPQQTMIGLVATAFAFFALSSFHKLNLAIRSIITSNDEVVTQEELDALDDADLPFYTVLVPLYREGELVSQLVSALGQLEYPRSKLEVLLLLEEDDEETRRAVDRLVLPPYFQRLVVPEGSPKGKPRALNYGLLYARGEYCCVYDAEDVPDPKQLKKVARVFQRSGKQLLCVQCKLDFYNPGQNALTNLFALDYSAWFDLVLPGLHSQSLPIPLGGTSNHFRVAGLREVGAWDAFNVTEDLDLGMRLHRAGYRTAMVDSVTMEEATSGAKNWIGQRTRWLKGYMVTYLVHMRRPLRLWKDLRPSGFISTQLLIGGGVLAPLLSPLFWALLVVWYTTKWSALELIFAGPLLYFGTFLLFGITFAFVWLGALAGLRRGQMYSVKYALLLPMYWALLSYAAYRALFELAASPHYWQKTQHGLFNASDKASEGAALQ
jgi:cellulose synthase/poly-beta-1,6-N-acetylglucosamine synthase-like glycosyltransferase